MKKYRDREWLEDQINGQKKSRAEIAEKINTTPPTISRWTEKFNIEKERRYKDKEWLEDQINNQKKSQAGIAEGIDATQRTISRWAKKFDIEKEREYRDKEWLEDQINNQKKSQAEIAEGIDVTRRTIRRWAKRFDIEAVGKQIISRRKEREKREKAKNNPLEWNTDLAYLSGLITSDGSLRQDRPAIDFISKDKSLVKQVQEIAENNLDIKEYTPSQGDDRAWSYYFFSRRFYYFLENIGLMPNKSHKLGKLDVPDNMFLPWLRGEIDGDGSFYTDREYLHLSITSGSKNFLEWISDVLDYRNLVKGQGNVNPDNDSFQLNYYHKDSQSVARTIYEDTDYHLQRKYNVAKEFVDALE